VNADRDWPETFREFRRIAAESGVREVAQRIPADYSTVYRMLRGETAEPTRAVRAGIERIVTEHQRKD